MCRTSRVCSDSQPMICAREAGPSVAAHRTAPSTLRRLLMGDPLTDRDARRMRELGRELNALLEAVIVQARHALDSCTPEAFDQLTLEWRRIIALKADYAGLVSKRGAFLFAAWREPTILEHWRATDAELIDDLREWILPLVVPAFVKGMAQQPARLGVMVSVLAQMWEEPRAMRERRHAHAESHARLEPGSQC